uniref:Uncharacterized protein n=1 Tax=Neogobius melanostomus TaxID=47308 RepID=A0A8C6T8P9_9GOBI
MLSPTAAMATAVLDRSRAAVAYGLRAVPLLFQQLQSPGSESRHRALNSLCDLLHDPERLYQTVTGAFVRCFCDLLTCFRRTLLASSLLAPLSLLLDDPDGGCRVAVHRVLNRLALLPSDVNKSTQRSGLCCHISLLHSLPKSRALRLRNRVVSYRDKIANAINRSALLRIINFFLCSVPVEGKRQLCALGVLSVLMELLRDPDTETRVNAAGVFMNALIITSGTADTCPEQRTYTSQPGRERCFIGRWV